MRTPRPTLDHELILNALRLACNESFVKTLFIAYKPGQPISLEICVLWNKPSLGDKIGPLHKSEITVGKANRKYKRFAQMKAFLAHNKETSTRELRDAAPHMLAGGDITWTGGVYNSDIAVGVSGLPEHLDEVVAWNVLNMIIGLARQCMNEIRILPSDKRNYIPHQRTPRV